MHFMNADASTMCQGAFDITDTTKGCHFTLEKVMYLQDTRVQLIWLLPFWMPGAFNIVDAP